MYAFHYAQNLACTRCFRSLELCQPRCLSLGQRLEVLELLRDCLELACLLGSFLLRRPIEAEEVEQFRKCGLPFEPLRAHSLCWRELPGRLAERDEDGALGALVPRYDPVPFLCRADSDDTVCFDQARSDLEGEIIGLRESPITRERVLDRLQ